MEQPEKGYMGEVEVQFGAIGKLPSEVYRNYRNVTLETKATEAGTTQIDFVIVSVFGVFVVEVKNMKGKVYGSEGDSHWTRKFSDGKQSKVRNPLKQNEGHIRALERMLSGLELPRETFKSVVIFVDDYRTLKFMTKLPKNVTIDYEGTRYIQSFREKILSENQVQRICEEIETTRLRPSLATNQRHIRNVRRARKRWEQRRCRRCGGQMRLLKAKRGPTSGSEFLGCENYPECRNTIDLDC